MGWKSLSVPVDYPRWRKLRQKILKERGRKCQKCGKSTGYFEVDHIIPVYRGGKFYDEKNLQILCRECHRHKSLKEHPKIGKESRKWKEHVKKMLKN